MSVDSPEAQVEPERAMTRIPRPIAAVLISVIVLAAARAGYGRSRARDRRCRTGERPGRAT